MSVHTDARYYEPNSGRFLSADPMGQSASPSLYDFAGGDPVNSFDPTGRCPVTVDVYGPQMSDRRTEFTQSGFPQSETQPLAFGVNSADPNPVNSGSNLLGNALGSLLGGLWDATGGAIVRTFNAGVDNIAGAIESAQSGDYTMAALQAVSAAGNVANLALAAVGVGEVVGAGVEALAGTAVESAEAAVPGEIASAGKVATDAAETGASVAEATVPAEEATVAEASPSGSTVQETADLDENAVHSQQEQQQYSREAVKDGANLPADAQQALDEIEQGSARPNVRNPKPFENDGRGGTVQLPTHDAAGNPIDYTEHTVNPRPPGGSLDGKRIMTGNDGSVWYTGDHMTTYTRVK